MLTGSAWFGKEGSPVLEEGETPDEPTFLRNVTFRADDSTDPDLVADDALLVRFNVIEANIKGAQGNSNLKQDADGGVAVSDDRDHEFRQEADPDNRDYYGRLFESRWSSTNWTPAKDPNEQVAEDESPAEEGGVLDPLWEAIGWE